MADLIVRRTIEVVNPDRITFKASINGGWIYFQVSIDGIHLGNLYPNGHWVQPDNRPRLGLVEVPSLGIGFVDITRRLESFLEIEKDRQQNP